MSLWLSTNLSINDLWVPSWLDSAWDPFELMVILRSSDSRKESEPILALRSALGWLETQDAHMSKADLPGLKKDDVKVQLKDERILQISRAWRRLRKAMLGTLWSVLM